MPDPQCPKEYPSIGLIGWTLHMKDYIDRKVQHRLVAGALRAEFHENGLALNTGLGTSADIWYDPTEKGYRFDRYARGQFMESGFRSSLEAVFERLTGRAFQGHSTS